MVKLASKLKLNQIIVFIKQLPKKDKLKLFKKLEQERWANQLDEVTSRIRGRLNENRITDAEIDKIVEEVREQRYQARSGRL